MDHKYINSMLSQMDKELAAKGMNRRDAMKLLGISGAGMFMGATNASAAEEMKEMKEAKSGVDAKIVIVGGGLAGMSTARRLLNYLDKPDITVIEPEELSVSYQPGQTLVGGGIWDIDDIKLKRDDYVPDGVKIIKEKVIDFHPQANELTTAEGTVVSYDYLVLALGMHLDFERTKGLEAAGRAMSSGDNSRLLKAMGDDGVCSIYTAEGAEKTWEQMQKYIEKAKNVKDGKKVQFLFTHPSTPIKCGGAPKKIMYLTNSRLKEAGARENAELTFYPAGGAMFGVPQYHDAIMGQFKREGFKWKFRHNLIEIDKEKKIATFDAKWQEKGPYDPIMRDYEVFSKHEKVRVPYDFIHVTPNAIAPREVAESDLGSAKGWVPVNKETLQHIRYDNVFSLGDVAQVPMGNTGGSVRKQYKVLVTNLIARMEGKKLPAKYAGYTVCPLITSIGTVMLAEFNWTREPTPSFPLDPTVERWMWWLMKIYLLKPMTVIGMLQTGKA